MNNSPSRRVTDSDLHQLLRTHDIAEPDTTSTRTSLDARLTELPAASTVAPVVPLRPRRRTMRRVGGLVAAAAAGALALVMLPGTGQSVAYASWTATPQAVADRDRDAAAEACRDAQSGPFWARQKGGPEEFDPQSATVALAERRGDLVAVLLHDEGPLKDLNGFCVIELEPGAAKGRVGGTSVAGSVGGPPVAAPADGFFEGSMSQDGSGDETISMVAGVVGDNVAALTMHAGDLTAQATIADGRYAAWFPGRIFLDEPLPPSGEGGPEPIITYDLLLTDGTVITDAQPARPGAGSDSGPVAPEPGATEYTGGPGVTESGS